MAVFEHSPWVPEAAHEQAPFASVDALHAAMVAAVAGAGAERQLALLRAHPELAGGAALTRESAAEQGGIGLDRLEPAEAARFDAANAAYRARFGFPFIIAVRGARDRRAILEAMERRLTASPPDEHAAAMAEVAKIARFRLDALIATDGRVTTHVLDTAGGRPGAAMTITLRRTDSATVIGTYATNADGRTDAPLLQGEALLPGEYELVFEVGTWRRAEGRAGGFYETVPIRFVVDDPAAHYHVPLIVSPFGYATYRGS